MFYGPVDSPPHMSQLLLSSLAVVCPNCDGYNSPRSAACVLCGRARRVVPVTVRADHGEGGQQE
ncbi:hypothetical protein HNV28_28575, partial [Myxococcus xanthus]|nr:hypothetical protein [Myxococcus xanthus]